MLEEDNVGDSGLAQRDFQLPAIPFADGIRRFLV
jgi:hypothetical protein